MSRVQLSQKPTLPSIQTRLASLNHLIGDTPLLEVQLLYRGEMRTIFAKYEAPNFTGSIKDRMVLSIFRQAYAKGALKAGDTIVETKSGNIGISCAAPGRSLGHRVKIFVSKAEGGFVAGIAISEALGCSSDTVFLPRQFSNAANISAHTTGTGPEIWQQLKSCGREPDAFVAGVRTGGTVIGVGLMRFEPIRSDFSSGQVRLLSLTSHPYEFQPKEEFTDSANLMHRSA